MNLKTSRGFFVGGRKNHSKLAYLDRFSSPFQQHLAKRFALKRFTQMIILTCSQAIQSVLFKRIGCYCDNRNFIAAVAFKLANLSCAFETTHAWHSPIHENRVKFFKI